MNVFTFFIEQRKARWAGHVTRVGEQEFHSLSWLENIAKHGLGGYTCHYSILNGSVKKEVISVLTVRDVVGLLLSFGVRASVIPCLCIMN
jgi:hypothetical protein